MKKYIDLCLIGDSTIPERYEIIRKTKAKALAQMEDLKNQLDVSEYKENYYENPVKNNFKDRYNTVNKKTATVSA